jgi:hypothetical protein
MLLMVTKRNKTYISVKDNYSKHLDFRTEIVDPPDGGFIRRATAAFDPFAIHTAEKPEILVIVRTEFTPAKSTRSEPSAPPRHGPD